MWFYWYILVSVSLSSLLPRVAAGGRILGGREAAITDAPYQAALLYLDDFICGAAIISKKWLLSAAHCVESKPRGFLKARVGSSECGSGGELFQMSKVAMHPKYQHVPNGYDFDYALLRLKDEIVFDATKQPVKLPQAEDCFFAETVCLVSGWGQRTEGKEKPFAQTLHMTHVPLVDSQLCAELYQQDDYLNITESMLCAGHLEGGPDACFGDSGGPLVNEDNVLVGVVSGGKNCGMAGFPGTYARVSYIAYWINEVSGV